MECVAGEVIRHLEPIDAVHKFPPTQDLANESLNGGQRGGPIAIGFFGGFDAFHRIQKPQIQRSRNETVEHRGGILQHQILKIPKAGESFTNE